MRKIPMRTLLAMLVLVLTSSPGPLPAQESPATEPGEVLIEGSSAATVQWSQEPADAELDRWFDRQFDFRENPAAATAVRRDVGPSFWYIIAIAGLVFMGIELLT